MFWFLVSVVLIVILLVRRNSSQYGSGRTDKYSQGYWDGYRALGEKVQAELDKENIDRGVLKNAIDVGYGRSPVVILEKESSITPESVQQDIQTKEQSSLRNLNIILYMASFLFVAAAAALIAAAMPDEVKLVSVWLLAALFYGVGYGLYGSMPKLRPAAVAFLGTGMAIVPFAGFALYQYTDIGGAWSWFVTSFIGLVAYYVAAVKLQNQPVSYLVMAFVLSLFTSAAATASAPIIWYFVVLIGVSLVANIISLSKPGWVPVLFKEPVAITGQWVTPLALACSVFAVSELSLINYEVLFGIATAHYLVAWLQSREFEYETSVRILAHITALLVAWDVLNGSLVLFGFAFLFLSVAQLTYSLIRSGKPNTNLLYEKVWLYWVVVLQIISVVFWFLSDNQAILTAMSLSIVLVSSILFAFKLRHVPVLIFGLAASMAIPAIVMFEVVSPALEPRWLMTWYALVSVAIVFAWPRIRSMSVGFRRFLLGSLLSYIAAASLVAADMPTGESVVALFALSIILWTASYVLHKPILSSLGNLGLITAMLTLGRWLNIESEWEILAPMLVLALVFYYSYWLMIELGDVLRRKIQLLFTWTVLTIGILAGFFVTSTELMAAFTVVIAAVTIGVEAWRVHKAKYMELAIYIATFGLQRVCEIMFPELNSVLYAHWWAITIVAVGLWRRNNLQTRIIVGMGFITLVTGLFALGQGGIYQLLFLVENIILLVAGALTHRKWAIWWGVSASTLAVLWFLRDYSFLALGFLGLVLIGVVVWRLVRANNG